MRVARFLVAGDGVVHVGHLDGGVVRDLPPGTDPLRALRLPPADGTAYPIGDVELLAPVVPSKIIAVGLNYRRHAEEQGQPIPERPLLFAKFPSALTGAFGAIVKPDDTTQLDYEAELAVVIGARCRHVARSDAMSAVAGYAALNDVSARDAQFADGQWVRGKSFDTFAPLGPALVGSDEVPDVADVPVRCWVNDELRQDSSTSDLIFDVPALVEYCSRWFTLEPGDVIGTGTPGGVGVFLDPPRFLVPGDVVRVEIGGIGTLVNGVVAG